MIDITTIQNFPVPPSIIALQEANEALKLAKDTLIHKNENLQKIVIVSVITIGLITTILILKNTKKKQNENSNNKLRRK